MGRGEWETAVVAGLEEWGDFERQWLRVWRGMAGELETALVAGLAGMGRNQNGKKKILRSHLEMTRHVCAQEAAQVAHQCESTMTKETQMHRKTPYTTKEYVYDNVG